MSYAENKYWGKIIAHQWGETSNKNPQWVVSFSIMGIINPADPQGALLACAPGDRSVYRALTEGTKDFFWRDVDALCALKEIESRPGNPSEVGEGDFDFVGIECAFGCRHETYQGKAKEKWDFALGGGAPDVKPMEATEVAKMDALFGRGKTSAKPPARRATTPPVTQASDKELAAAGRDGIPF